MPSDMGCMWCVQSYGQYKIKFVILQDLVSIHKCSRHYRIVHHVTTSNSYWHLTYVPSLELITARNIICPELSDV